MLPVDNINNPCSTPRLNPISGGSPKAAKQVVKKLSRNPHPDIESGIIIIIRDSVKITELSAKFNGIFKAITSK